MQESKFQFTATDVTGNTFMLTTDIQPEFPAGPAAATLAARMQLPDNVPYTLRNESTSVYLDETLPLGDQIEPDTTLTITPKTHLG